ncbi:MAG: ABC transporter ATP-binding protein [Gemmatimonadota bacterium]|nr:MAG: ABC transporter ATP-binding protein [Gemmatimonadota bacterium]
MRAVDPDAILSLARVTKSYGDVRAVEDLSLDVFRGEILGLLGPNGAGKTTTINLICGLLQCDSGSVMIAGRSLQTNYRECKQMMGLCPQDLAIWESLTCQEQLEFVALQYDLGWRDARARALELLNVLGLSEKRRKLARTLSGGMKRRLNIGLALVHNPRILILDEPQAGLDPQSRVLVREYVRSLAERTTVILTTHDMDEADRLAQRIAIIDHGHLLELDTADGLKARVGTGDILEIQIASGREEEVNRLLQTSPEQLRDVSYFRGALRLVVADVVDRLPAVLHELGHLGVEVRNISIRKTTLEDVFIALTGRRLRE